MLTGKRPPRSGLTLAAIVLGASALTTTSAQSEAEHGHYPGLPSNSGIPNSSWVGATQSGIAYSAKTAQWAKIPLQIVAALTASSLPLPESQWPTDWEGPTRTSMIRRENSIYFVSPPGSKENYGYSKEFTINALAFGTVPVQATMQLSQRRDKNGFPTPLYTHNYYVGYDGVFGESDTHVKDNAQLTITKLAIDGHNLKLKPTCRTKNGVDLNLRGRGTLESNETTPVDTNRPWETGHYFPAKGGLLTGTINITEFQHCTTNTGENLSPLITNAISGTNNPIKIHVSTPTCSNTPPGAPRGLYPPPPGATTLAEAGCPPTMIFPPEFTYPPRNP